MVVIFRIHGYEMSFAVHPRELNSPRYPKDRIFLSRDLEIICRIHGCKYQIWYARGVARLPSFYSTVT